jgi:hypothetical protein
MSKEFRATRRHALQLLAATGVSGTPGILAADPAGSRRCCDFLTSIMQHRRSAAVIGRSYLRTFPADASLNRLLAGLAADGLAKVWLGSPMRLRAAVAHRIRSDFLHRRTVKIDGWVLSLTEARLCALCTLT